MTNGQAEPVAIDRAVLSRFVGAIRNFVTSEVGGRAVLMFCALFGLLLAINGLNVVNSYVGRDFITAIENRSMPAFLRQALLYVGVFAASTIAAVTCRFAEERLGLLWRAWLTKRALDGYLDHRNYLHLREMHGDVLNPDQRIGEDIRTFVVTTLSFVLMALNALFTVIAFSGVLFSISRLLWVVAVAYAVLGSIATIALGRPLVRLNYDQSDREAALRADLIHVRENAESIAMANREHRLRRRLQGRLDDVVSNFRKIVGVNRNLGFFTTGYNYMIQIIPALLVAPLFIQGKVEFGVITQSAMAFSQLLGAFSLIVTQFQPISSYAAVVVRLTRLVEAFEPSAGPVVPVTIVTRETSDHVAYEALSLRSPDDGRPLVTALSLSIPRGTRVLVVSAEELRASALLRATAGLWDTGEGQVLRPAGDRVMFVAERPYILPGTLRELLFPGGGQPAITDEAIGVTLSELGLEAVRARAGGLDVERDWDSLLGLGEQQLLVLARVAITRPEFAFLYRIDATIGAAETARVLRILAARSVTYVTFAESDALASEHDAVLELKDEGKWTWKTLGRGELSPQ